MSNFDISTKENSLLNTVLSSNETRELQEPEHPTTPAQFKTIKFKEPDYPNSISRSWIPLIQMIELYTFNPKFAKSVQYLIKEKHLIGWKKIRGDGNCYYTAVILKYIENIHKPYINCQELKSFLSILNEIKVEIPDKNYEFALEKMKSYIKSSIANKEQGQHFQVFIKSITKVVKKKFHEISVRVARLVTLNLFKDKFTKGELTWFMVKSENDYIKDITTLGTEAEDLTLLLLPEGLNAQVHQFNIFEDSVYEQLIPEKEGIRNKVHIIRRGGHYDLVYSKEEQELDQYCFYNKTYYFTE